MTLTGNVRLHAQNALEAETKEHRDARMEWWREAKFGMFIHWGVYWRVDHEQGENSVRGIPGLCEGI